MRVLISVDFGLFGKAQIAMMRKLNFGKDTKVKVLHIIEPLCWELQTGYPATMQLSDAVVREFRESAKKLVHDVACDLKEQTGIENIDEEVREGAICDQIISAAQSFEADMLLVGSHGKSGIARFLLGSTSHAVSTHAGCSVLIARQDQPKNNNCGDEK